MNAQIRVNTCIAVERAVKTSLNPNITWKEEETNKV